MLSRRTLIKYSGLAWLVSLLKLPDGGCEQLPTNMVENPWDARQRPMLGEGDDIPIPWYRWFPITRLETWMPKDGQTVLLATDGGGPCLCVATFYAGDEKNDWSFITHENNNEILRGQLGDKYCWMPLPDSPYAEGFWQRHPTGPR